MQRMRRGPRGELETPHAPLSGRSYQPLSSKSCDTRDWPVKRLAYDLRRGSYVASHLMHGDLNTFWAYDRDTLNLTRASNAVKSWSSDPRPLGSSLQKQGDGYRLHLAPETRELIKVMTLSFARAFPDKPVTVHAAGSRPSAIIADRHRLRHTSTFCQIVDSECLRSSIANAIHRFSYSDAVKFLERGPIPDGRMGTVNRWR